MSRKDEIIVIIIVVLSVFPSVFILSRISGQMDITENKIYSLDDSTVNILDKFDQPLYITWWKSDLFDSPQLDLMADLLNLFPGATDNYLNVSVKNPSEDDKNRLKKLGLVENQIETAVEGELKQQLIFSGLEITYVNKTVLVPFIAVPESLEFKICEALTRILDGGVNNLAFFSDSSEDNTGGLYTLLTSGLTSYFNVISVTDKNPLTIIPHIMIVSDRVEYTIEQLYAIDRTIQSGVPVIFLIDGLKIDPRANDYARLRDDESILLQWLERYGVVIEKALIFDDNSLLLNYASGASQRYNNYNFWFKGTDQFDLLWASPLRINKIEGITSRVLVESSQFSRLIEGEVDLRPEAYADSSVYTGPYPVEVELNGEFQALFQQSQNNNPQSGTIVVIGSTLSFSDLIQTSGSSDNLFYLQNLIYRLLDKEDLYNIAQKSRVENLLDRETLFKGNGQKRVKIISLIFLPIFIICFYGVSLYRRKKNRNDK